MTKQINNWKEKRKQKNYEQEFVNRRETVTFNLFNGVTTEESLRLFKDIKSLFYHKIESRLSAISEEKKLIEAFLEK